VQHRYHCDPAGATLFVGRDGADVVFDEPQMAVTPGQGAAFYRGDLLLGGGWIESTPRARGAARYSPIGAGAGVQEPAR
jgi:tRNA-specific 2-thiouridylase